MLAVGLVALLPGLAHAVPATEPTPEQAKFFEAKVRPLLAENCFKCHSDKKQKGHLRLDSLAASLKGGENGPALVPGHPEKSRLIQAVAYTDEDLKMPPEDRDKLSAEQVAVLTEWVMMGAPWPAGSGAGATVVKSKRRTITPEDRAFWSFQLVKDSPVPTVDVDGAKWCRNEIDRFVWAKLKADGLTPAGEADRATLIRRLTFDLHGLPPTPSEVEAFVSDTSPDAYEKLVERLLASPRYGERYARHWLDLVRYAESDGFKQDGYRPNVWPYRDWVIGSLNADKPYDRFVAEQLAGDEIAPEDPNVLVATTYLRLGIYEYNQRDAPKQRGEALNDITDVTADAVLGLSMGCARCHDHKFDPILQSDYYRLQGFFAPVVPKDDAVLATPKQKAEYAAALSRWEQKTAKVREQIEAIEGPVRRNTAKAAIGKFPPETQSIYDKPADQWTPYERQVAYLMWRQVEEELKTIETKVKGADKDKLAALKLVLAEFDKDKPKPLPPAFVSTDVGPVAPPSVIPGDPENRDLGIGYPVVLDGQPLTTPPVEPTSTTTGRRTALARWVGQPNNPLTTRVITNRLWQWHFGQGLVRTSSDYGRLGEPPTHPELLDWLTTRFVQGGWRMKSLHRLIVTSATYRQASVRPVPDVAKLKDPEDRWLWRYPARRLDAEQVRDSVLAVSGELQAGLEHAGGPAADFTAPRRSVYTKCARNNHDPLLEVFDLPESFGSIATRNTTTTATQSLMMMNGDWPLKRAAAFASRVRKEAPSADPGSQVDTAYRLAYGRPPTADERAAAVAFLANSDKPKPAPDSVASAAGTGNSPPAAGAAAPDPNAPSSETPDRPITQPMPHRGGQAVLVRNANPGDMLRLPPSKALPTDDFTIETFVLLESIYDDASVRVIASQWDGKQDHPGWSFGVTSEKSKHQPRNLILQLACDAGNGKTGYEVIPSDFRIELHKTYYVAASVKLKDTAEAGVTFYVKDLTDMDAPLRSVGVKHRLTGPYANASPFVIGGRDAAGGQRPNGWDGLVDEVRLTRSALKPEQLLYNDGPDAGAAIAGHWRFEEQSGFFKDAAGVQADLTRTAGAAGGKAGGAKAAAASKVDAGLLDLCHVLLNSDEFLYVD